MTATSARLDDEQTVTEDKPKLLIVEDDLGLQKQLQVVLRRVRSADRRRRASEALAQLRRFEPPVVLQDLGLPPDAEGVSEGMRDAASEILSLAPHTKVIVVTGNARSRQRGARRVARRLRFLPEAASTPTCCG